MPGNVFYFLISMSITASLIAIVLMIIRLAAGRWIPRNALFLLWGIVIFRLLVPISIPSRFSLMNLINGCITRTVAVPVSNGRIPEVSIINSVRAVSEYFPLQYKSEAIQQFFTISGIVWAAVAALLITGFIIVYIMIYNRLKRTGHIIDNDMMAACCKKLNIRRKVLLFQSKAADTPLVLGIVKPCIIIPGHMPEASVEYVLMHELCHIKRHDNLWKVIFGAAVCIHWFNPVVWLILHIWSGDMELACDERVIRYMGECEKKAYAGALVSLAARQRPYLTAFSGIPVKSRVMNIIYYRNISLYMAVISAVICIVLAVLLITNPLL